MARTKIGYNVYHAPDGCDIGYYGFATTLADARRVARGNSLPRCDWDTARRAGQCGGLYAPSSEGEEDEEGTVWLTGDNCAVPVYATSGE